MRYKTKFTLEQMEELAANPFTFKVTPRYIWFTLEFKNLFLARFESGDTIMEIFESCGYRSELLGKNRIYAFHRRLQDELSSGQFREGPPVRYAEASEPQDFNTLPAQQSVAAMQREIVYLRQQLDFLKKITELESSKKPRT